MFIKKQIKYIKIKKKLKLEFLLELSNYNHRKSFSTTNNYLPYLMIYFIFNIILTLFLNDKN